MGGDCIWDWVGGREECWGGGACDECERVG